MTREQAEDRHGVSVAKSIICGVLARLPLWAWPTASRIVRAVWPAFRHD